MAPLLLIASLLAAGPTSPAQRNTPALPANAVTRAGVLVGCWHMSSERGGPSVRQNWTRVSADLIVGTAIRVTPGFRPEYSFLRIESGSLVWQAPGEPPIRMPVDSEAALVADVIAFANPGAGLPKRVEFRRGKGEMLLMLALYEGTKALETPMKKVNCS